MEPRTGMPFNVARANVRRVEAQRWLRARRFPSRAGSRSTAGALAIAAIVLPIAACGDALKPISSDGISAAVYEPDGASFDVLRVGNVVSLDGGCLGLESDGQRSVLALAKGSSIGSNGRITAVGDGDHSTSFKVGDDVTLTGSSRGAGAKDTKTVTYPDACPDDLPVWYALPVAK